MTAMSPSNAAQGSNPDIYATCELSLLLVVSFAPRGFSPGTPVFTSPQKPNPISPGIGQMNNHFVEVLPLYCYLYIYLGLHFREMMIRITTLSNTAT